MNIPPKAIIAKLVADPKKVQALFDEFDRLGSQLLEREIISTGQDAAEPGDDKARPASDALTRRPANADVNVEPAAEMPSAYELISRIVEMKTCNDAALAKDA